MNIARVWFIPTVIASALLASCASMPGDESVAANTRSHECKIVRIDSASEAIRNETRGPTMAKDDLARAEGIAGVARTLERPEPRPLRNAAGTSITEQLLQGC